eukprot:9662213-Heterocapsa_arctica.AAC.1
MAHRHVRISTAHGHVLISNAQRLSSAQSQASKQASNWHRCLEPARSILSAERLIASKQASQQLAPLLGASPTADRKQASKQLAPPPLP